VGRRIPDTPILALEFRILGDDLAEVLIAEIPADERLRADL
jgi:hypothetical protein